MPSLTTFFLIFGLAASVNARTWMVANTNVAAADNNPGTDEKPLLTINAAAQQAQPGDIILVHSGIYRERVTPLIGGKLGKPIIYQAMPGESVVVKGSDVWSDWKPDVKHPGVFRAKIADHIPADIPNPYLIGISIASSDQDIVARPSKVLDNLPKTLGQIFYDENPVAEVNSEEAVLFQENTWVVTADGQQLLAHFPSDPENLASHLVEVSTRNRIFSPQTRGLSYIHVKGFTFEHCANQGPFPQGGEVSPRSGSYWLIEGNTIRFAKTVGIDIGSETFDVKGLKDTSDEQKVRMNGGHHIIQGNTVSDNGLVGIEGWHQNGAVIRNNIVERNNALGFNTTDAKWEEWGGIKLHGTNALIEGNLVRDNDGYGIWIDNDYTGARITRNVVLNNRMAGIFLELGDGRCLIDNNIVALTRPRGEMYGGVGVYAHDASGLIIVHNLVCDNADCGILLRTVSNRVFPPSWHPNSRLVRTSNTQIINNIIWNNSKAAISLPYPNERAIDNVSDYNIVYGSRELQLGFEHNPALFGVNLYKSSITIDQLITKLEDILSKSGVNKTNMPNLNTWRYNPTLSLLQWSLLMGQDLHSEEAPKLVSLMLRPRIPMISYKVDPQVLQMHCPTIDGVDRDFFGNKFRSNSIYPGPFQDMGNTEIEHVLFPVRF
jgi:hypothetical protein